MGVVVNSRKIGEWNSGSGIRMKGKKAPERSHFTIMISRGPGKVRSFRISSKLLFGSILFFALFVLGSLLCLYLYVDTLHTNKTQKALLEQPQSPSLKAADKSDSGRKDSEPAEESDHPKNGLLATDKNKKTQLREPAEEKAGDPPVMEAGSSLVEKGIQEEKVGIEKFTISRDGKNLSIQFRVTNENLSHQKIEGFVFAIAMAKEKDQPGFWSCPKTPFHNGVPAQYGQGKPFRIINYRNIRCTFSLDSQDTIIRSINILVYNKLGKCILNEEVDTTPSKTDEAAD